MSDELTKERKAVHFALATARNDALEDAQQIAVRIMREEEAHGGDIARERAGAAEEIADAIRSLKSETKP